MPKLSKFISALVFSMAVIPMADACTRILYKADGDRYLIGRTMDWFTDTATDVWAFPSRMKRDGGVGPNSIIWTSKHSSIISSFYNAGAVDGINEQGLGANLLYLAESDYGDYKKSTKPLLSIGGWLQYVLDNFSSVAEAVDALAKEPFAIVAPILPDGNAAAAHLSISDKSGDSAIFEYINGKLIIHHGRQYNVMTNSPPFDQQLAISNYWKKIGGNNFLPGTNSAADRFVRMNAMLQANVPSSKPNSGMAEVVSLVRTISVPLSEANPTAPNASSTRWRTAADLTAKRYLYDSAYSPSVFWVDLDKLNMKPGGPAMKLDLQANPILAGEVSSYFKSAEPFKFLAPRP